MKSFQYVITDPMGIHARPAGLLVKEAQKYTSKIMISTGGRTADLKRILGVMSLGAKQGAEITITAEGGDEEAAAAALEQFLKDNL